MNIFFLKNNMDSLEDLLSILTEQQILISIEELILSSDISYGINLCLSLRVLSLTRENYNEIIEYTIFAEKKTLEKIVDMFANGKFRDMQEIDYLIDALIELLDSRSNVDIMISYVKKYEDYILRIQVFIYRLVAKLLERRFLFETNLVTAVHICSKFDFKLEHILN